MWNIIVNLPMFNKKNYNMKTKEKTFTEFTPIGKTYWNDDGIYQKEFTRHYDWYVPNSGDAPTIHGELLRAVSRLNYDYFNNGNCNVQEVIEDDCPDCYGTGWQESDYDDEDIDEYYQRMIDFLQEYSNAQNEIDELVKFLTDYYHYRRPNLFAEKKAQLYTRLIDKIMQQILI